MEVLMLSLMMEGKEQIEMSDKKLSSTPTALFSAGMQIGILFGQVATANVNAVLTTLQGLKFTLDTKEFSDLKGEVESFIEMIKSLPYDKPLDEGSRASLVGALSGWNRVIGERIKTYLLSSPRTLLNPERLLKGPTEWIYEPIWNKLDRDTQIDLLGACLSELYGIHTAAAYLAIRGTKRCLKKALELPKEEEALAEAERILKGEKETSGSFKKEALQKYLPSLLEKEKELSHFKILFENESSEVLTSCFSLANEIFVPAPEEE